MSIRGGQAVLVSRRVIKVATLTQISDLLKKTEQSQRVLEEVTEGFVLDVIREEDFGDETISIEKLTGDDDISPVIRLVDTTIFNALERRASDIHIETRSGEVAIKYRIDGVLHYAMPPISKDWHQTIISRIKVMSELDIAERRVPQDGRFRVRYKGRQIDFRVSIMPTVHRGQSVLTFEWGSAVHGKAVVTRSPGGPEQSGGDRPCSHACGE
jgi:type IV pilus assembly protein PilB